MTNARAKELLVAKYGNKCMLCGRKLKHEEQTFHHILPKQFGGEATEENGAILCVACHKRVHKSEFGTKSYFTINQRILNNKIKRL